LADQARANSAGWFVTTQKDLVKLPQAQLGGLPLWGMEIAAEVLSGDGLVDQWLQSLGQSTRKVA
jgi:hypothetical protein